MKFPLPWGADLTLAVYVISCFGLVQSVPASLEIPKPTIVLVPGAFHSPIHYALLISRLYAQGYEVVCQRNPSCDSPYPFAQTAAKDTSFIRSNLLMPLIDDGKEVILAVHSYGGLPGAAAAKGLSKTEVTAAGKKGGVVGLIFICALIAKEGDSLLSILPGQVFDPWVIQYVSLSLACTRSFVPVLIAPPSQRGN